jgi:hypothetical protein
MDELQKQLIAESATSIEKGKGKAISEDSDNEIIESSSVGIFI